MIVGFEIRSAMNPSPAMPTIVVMAPTIRASADASATARAGSPSAARSGRRVAAIIGPNDESGPSTRIFEGPNSAYATRQRIEVYRPVIGGKPASSAYAIPCGTRSAVSTSPAMTSWRSQLALYDESVASPGSVRVLIDHRGPWRGQAATTVMVAGNEP